MTSKWKYRISVRAVILSLSSYFVFPFVVPFVKPGDRLKFGGRVWFSVPDDLSLEELTTFCSSFSAGADKRSTTFVSTAKRLTDNATCEPTSCASSSFGAAKSSYTRTTSSICLNGRFAFWISNREAQKPGGPVAWQAGPRRHRKSAAVRAGTCEFWISTSTIRPWQNRSWSRRPCSASRECCRTGSSRLAQGVARSRAGEGRTTAQRIRTISTGSLQPAGGRCIHIHFFALQKERCLRFAALQAPNPAVNTRSAPVETV